MLNKFGKPYGIYVQSDFGWMNVDGKKVKQFRYFVPSTKNDIDRTKIKLENSKDTLELKEESLQHLEMITLPHEQQLEELREQTER